MLLQVNWKVGNGVLQHLQVKVHLIKISGCSMVNAHADDRIGEIALAIEMGADAVDIVNTIYPLPMLGKCIGMAAEMAHGSCSDVPPARK